MNMGTNSERQESFNQISNFVNQNRLRDDKSNILFKAEVTFSTALTNSKVFESIIRIEFNGYDGFGKLEILANDIDSKIYPTSFSALFQTYSIDENGNLCITGYHNQNPRIGSYMVLIRIVEKYAKFYNYDNTWGQERIPHSPDSPRKGSDALASSSLQTVWEQEKKS